MPGFPTLPFQIPFIHNEGFTPHCVFYRHLDQGKCIVEQPAAGLALFGPDGRWLAIASGAEAAIWDTHTDSELFRLRMHSQEISGLTFITEGRSLLTVSADGMAHTWDTSVMIERLASDTGNQE